MRLLEISSIAVMGWLEWTAVGAACALLLAIIIVVFAIRNNKNKAKKNLVETRDARYTYDNAKTTTESGDAKMTFAREDILVGQGQKLTVGTGKGQIKPGKYIVLATDDKTPEFNLRVGSYVKEYKHNQEVVLAEGIEFTAISASVILR